MTYAMKVLVFFSENRTHITDKQEIVNTFNEYFVSIGNKLASLIPESTRIFSSYLNAPKPKFIIFYPTTATEIIEIISDFKRKWSADVDEIPINIMKASINYLVSLNATKTSFIIFGNKRISKN